LKLLVCEPQVILGEESKTKLTGLPLIAHIGIKVARVRHAYTIHAECRRGLSANSGEEEEGDDGGELHVCGWSNGGLESLHNQ
jgi:hypothetical protein